jgi:6-pyruvoyl-tetrahydropterin synthase
MDQSQARSHYPEALREVPAAYRQVGGQRQPVIFNYAISHTFTRHHANPPIWHDAHPHEFRVTLHLQAMRGTASMYGIDMIEVENLLKYFCQELPAIINQHPACSGGTTEEMCSFFARIPLDSHITLLRVDVAENSDRVTSLIVVGAPGSLN